MRMLHPLRSLIIICMFILCAGAPALAQQSYAGQSSGSGSGQPLQVIIDGPGQTALGFAVAAPLGGVSGANAAPLSGKSVQMAGYIRDNLSILPFLNYVEDGKILGGVVLSGYSAQHVDIRRFKMSGADIVITMGWPDGDTGDGPHAVELRAIDTFSGQQIAARRYTLPRGLDMTGEAADRFSNEVLKALTGSGQLFSATLAFTRSTAPNQKNIFIARPGGRGLSQVTREQAEAMSPCWSRDGQSIAFTVLEQRAHSLGIWTAVDSVVRKTPFVNSVVISPTFMPDGKIAVSLSTSAYQDIFVLNRGMQRERTLESSSAIDISPSFDASGRLMAFCSNRLGGPQIFLKDLSTGAVTRISKSGNYNTSPSISADGSSIAFVRRTDQGHRIFVYDLVSNQERQISFGPGSDEDPAFAPDGYFVAFTSSRSGSEQIYLTTRYGAQPKRLPLGRGNASMPAWGVRGN